ncbi:MAG: GAF domain-containing protein [Gemmatimonadales bacterium]
MPNACDFTGLSLEEGRRSGWQAAIHPADLPGFVEQWRSMLASGEPGDLELRLRQADGAYRWFLVTGGPLRDAAGRVVTWYGMSTDIEDRKDAEALLAGEKRFLEMVARGHAMPAILDALCRFVESTAGGCFCSVVLVDPSGTRLEHCAAPSLPASFIASINGRPVTAEAGPSAMAAALNQQVIAGDLESETRWADYQWCDMALAHGLKACWSTPILSTAGKVLGAFAIYYNEPRTWPRSSSPRRCGSSTGRA